MTNRKEHIVRHSSPVTCHLLLVIGTWLFVVSPGFAQDASFAASVDRSRLAMGERFEMTFTLEGPTTGKNFRPPPFNDFLVLSGPNQSTSMQIMNGAMSASVSYTYILQPRSEGKFTIGSAAIEVNGEHLKSQPVMIEVTKAPAQAKKPDQPGDTDISGQIAENLFLRVTVDKHRVYQGEQITATYKLYWRVNLANYNITKVPTLTGFWSEDLEVPKQVQLRTEVVDGKQFRVGILKKVALFPQRSGTLSLDEMEAECVVQVQTRRRSRDLFDQFFSDPFFGNITNVSQRIVSERVKVTVLPLPAHPPAGFAGAVGKFSLEAWLDKRQTSTNESVTLKAKIIGRGNLKLIDPPPLTFPPGMEQFDPKISDNISRQGDLVNGSRTFEYLCIPRQAGNQTIPSFNFSYFDVERKSYVTLASPEFVLAVEQGTELATSPGGLSKEDIQLLGEDIRFIKSGDVEFRRRGEKFVGSATFYVLSFSPVVAFFGFILYVKRRERTLGDITLLRRQRAKKMAQRRLAQAKEFLQERKDEQFFAEVSRALWGYASDKSGIPTSELSTESLRHYLETRGVSGETIEKLSSTLERCEFARFAPGSNSHGMDTVYAEAVNLISTIEGRIR